MTHQFLRFPLLHFESITLALQLKRAVVRESTLMYNVECFMWSLTIQEGATHLSAVPHRDDFITHVKTGQDYAQIERQNARMRTLARSSFEYFFMLYPSSSQIVPFLFY